MDSRQEIEQAEKEIDDAFASSPLAHLDYSQAVWTLLSFNEDNLLKAIFTLEDEKLRSFVDARLFQLTYPLRVCLTRCKSSGAPLRRQLNDANYHASLEWLTLASHYCQFFSMFSLWHRGRIHISISGNRLIAHNQPKAGRRYEAYNILIHKEGRPEASPTGFDELDQELLAHMTIRRSHFRVDFKPPLVARLVSCLLPAMTTRFKLPANWEFRAFNLEQYRTVMLTLRALMLGWQRARVLSTQRGVEHLGYNSSVWVIRKDELVKRLVRYTAVQRDAVDRIIDYITFGSNQIRHPDIALQPVIDLKNGSYALAPFVFLFNDIERNLCALLNQIPFERELYSRLSNDKETVTKNEIEQFLLPYDFEFRTGEVQGTNVDLAIIDRAKKVCLCLELKWFIEPAEIREIEQRGQELAQGVIQAKKIQSLFERGDANLITNVLRIDASYTFLCAVASVNWIGFEGVQDSQVPIIKVWHLMHYFKEVGSLSKVVRWLRSRAYLPYEERDFMVKPWELSCGRWAATWYTVEPCPK
jgi:hypothetical protein